MAAGGWDTRLIASKKLSQEQLRPILPLTLSAMLIRIMKPVPAEPAALGSDPEKAQFLTKWGVEIAYFSVEKLKLRSERRLSGLNTDAERYPEYNKSSILTSRIAAKTPCDTRASTNTTLLGGVESATGVRCTDESGM